MQLRKTLLLLTAILVGVILLCLSPWTSERELFARRVISLCAPPGYSNALNLNEPQNGTSNYSALLRIWDPQVYLSKGYGRLPFPVEKRGKLPNAHAVVSRCRDKLKTLFFVHSATDHQVHRSIIRRYIGNAELSKAYDWTTVFFVGISDDSAVSKAVTEEAAAFGDVVVLPYLDRYQNLTYKFVYGMKWTIELCPSAKYIVKIDDDVVVNLARVGRYIRLLQMSPRLELHCWVWTRATVFRATNSPWYIPPNVYPRNMFPDYCSGRGVLFKSDALRTLYSASFCLPFHGIDDVYVTGDAAFFAKVGHVAINSEISQDGENWTDVAEGRVIFSHIQNPALRVKAWELIVKELRDDI